MHLALAALGIGEGDAVVSTTMTFAQRFKLFGSRPISRQRSSSTAIFCRMNSGLPHVFQTLAYFAAMLTSGRWTRAPPCSRSMPSPGHGFNGMLLSRPPFGFG